MSTYSKQLGVLTIKTANWWDYVDSGLSGIGMIPGVGTVANGISALGNAVQGNWGQAGLAAAGMIPGAGVFSGAAKLSRLGRMGVGLAKGIGGVASHVPGMTGMARFATPAIHAMQPYANSLNRASTYGGVLMGMANNQPNQPVPQNWNNMPMATAAQRPQFHMPDLSMFNNFFGNNQQPQQPMAQNYGQLSHSIYGTT